MAIAEFLQNGGFDHHLRKMRRFYACQMELMSDAVRRYFPPGTGMTRPTGGMCLWVELPAEVNALEVYHLGMASKISTAPGQLFSAKQKYQNFLRLNCGNPWSERIENAVRELGRVYKTLFILEYLTDPRLRRRVRRGLLKGDHNPHIGRAAVAPSLHPGMKRGGIRAHFPALNELSGAVEHREIKVFVGSVDADKECIGAVHGVGVVLVLTARTEAGDSNIEWLLPASEKSLRQGHAWQGKPVSSKSSRGPVVTALPLPGRHIFSTSNPLLRRRPISRLFTLRRAQNVNNFFTVG